MAGIVLFESACARTLIETEMTKTSQVTLGELDANLDELWSQIKLDKTILWSPVNTPWLPDEWPAGEGSTWVRYAYAQGIDPQLADAVRVALPWVRVEARQGEDLLTIIPMRSSLEDAGIQGIFPLPGGKQVILDMQQVDTPPFLWPAGMPASDSADEAKLRMAYQGWIRYNRVIANAVKDHHEAFLRWVELD